MKGGKGGGGGKRETELKRVLDGEYMKGNLEFQYLVSGWLWSWRYFTLSLYYQEY
jgi:hypothetical protein